MSWVPIGWNEFSWEAFATLTTGFAAVVAAAWVGHGQLRLMNRQAELNEAAERRAEKLVGLEIRSRIQDSRLALLERRLALIERFRAIFTVWSQDGRLTHGDLIELRSIAQQARLIYDDDSASYMFECFSQLQNAARDHLRANFYQEKNDEFNAEKYRNRAFASESVAAELVPKIMDQLQEATKIQNISSG